ncbi:hypothetical protein TREMEDRAFT_64544 [Tremella mesenterica DSM 1558]|uniref:uncharacterized protein n=1 Tax=Tremella mesenterica (strain ATCC 24925 / CBS 8224 / DSM 1558 / NBRC 9311 / NRRL Y-6157 / RJB 2259-6 / UBC 559-6) TaxID=578456 RepID=UPI0003F49DEF|nr:uncharacterized protein TREMEDRAFT_64544 [Tremella mesenterica DSM 1558]EIW67297.1 hypothetical protein TREMEDRAFT_64544 [Tremella mesenterica DSM 1558]
MSTKPSTVSNMLSIITSPSLPNEQPVQPSMSVPEPTSTKSTPTPPSQIAAGLATSLPGTTPRPQNQSSTPVAPRLSSSETAALVSRNWGTVSKPTTGPLLPERIAPPNLYCGSINFYITQYRPLDSSRLYLGITRDVLITAISSARRAYLISNAALSYLPSPFSPFTALWSSSSSSSSSSTTENLGTGQLIISPKRDMFMQFLDRYTNVGVYVIHHIFSMGELFAMSGFYLTTSVFKSAAMAALQSVKILDAIFGSSETSRALSSFIGHSISELLLHEKFQNDENGFLNSSTALTKAFTAFACLQMATWKRLEGRLKLRLIYDATLITEESPTGRKIIAINNLEPSQTEGITQIRPDDPPIIPTESPEPETPKQAEATPVDVDVTARPDTGMEIHIHPASQPAAGTSTSGLSVSPSAGDLDLPIEPDFDDGLKDYLQTFGEGLGIETTPPISSTTTSENKELDDISEDVPIVHIDREGGHRSPLAGTNVVNGKAARILSGYITPQKTELEEWVELDPQTADDELHRLPSVPNGTPAIPSKTLQEAAEHPHDNSERIQLALKHMTDKLLQRRSKTKTSRSMTDDEFSSEETSPLHNLDSSGSTSPSSFMKSGSTSPSTLRIAKRLFGVSPPSSPPSAWKDTYQSRRRRGSLGIFRRKKEQGALSSDDLPSLASRAEIMDKTTSTIISMEPIEMIDQHTADQKSKSDTFDNVGSSSSPQPRRKKKPPVEVYADPSAGLYPHDSLIRNIHRFMRYSTAAYGQNFMRIFKLGTYSFKTTTRHHANAQAFARHTGIETDNIILSSFLESPPVSPNVQAPPLVHYLVVDHSLKSVILTCRGTLGFSDVLVDFTCVYVDITLPHAPPPKPASNSVEFAPEYFVHSGMYTSARGLVAPTSTVHVALLAALEKYPSYGLVVCGHSLGGGVAALLAILSSCPAETFIKENKEREHPVEHPEITTAFVTSFSSGLPAGRPLMAYAFGPSAVASSDLARYARGLVVSVVQDSDVVPTLSLGVLRDMKNVALSLYEENNVAEEVVGRVIGLKQQQLPFKIGMSTEDHPWLKDDDMVHDWMTSLIKTMRADMQHDKLYPPGDVYIMENFDVLVSRTPPPGQPQAEPRKARRVLLRKCESVEERFREPVFSKTMLRDHIPYHYEYSTRLLYEAFYGIWDPNQKQDDTPGDENRGKATITTK